MDSVELDRNMRFVDRDIFAKFFRRFPQLKLMPKIFTFNHEKGTNALKEAHPIHDFIVKYKKLRSKGYSEYKAFSTVEAELSEILDKQLDETRILRGAALHSHGESYLDRSQRVAELESEMKLMRYMRDMPKHERNAADYLSKLEREVDQDPSAAGYQADGSVTDDDSDDNGIRRRRIEDLFEMDNSKALQTAVDYQPVMYKVIKDHEARGKAQDESLLEIQQGFLDRTERLLKQHMQRSHIHDGLKELSNQEIIDKVRRGPKKLKKRAQGFLSVLKRFNVTLDDDANPVFDHIKDSNIRNYLQKKESLVRVTLMQADLEFEYPQKLEKLLVKSDILTWLDEEEEKLKNIALEEFMETESLKKSAAKLTPGNEFHLLYDEYYGNKELVIESAPRLKIGAGGMIEKALTYEEYAAEHVSE